MYKTRQELIARALLELGVIGAGQPAQPEDAQLVDDEIGPVLSDLAFRGYYNYGDPDRIEEEAFVHLALILANSVARPFGKQPDDVLRVYHEARLKDLHYSSPPSNPVAVRYF